MKLSTTTDPVVAALTLLLTNTNTVVTASNFNAESYLSSAWDLINIPSQPNITPFALALSTVQVSIESSVQAAKASAFESAISKYHITATGLSATTITTTSNPAAQMVTPASVAFVAAAAVGVGAAALLREL